MPQPSATYSSPPPAAPCRILFICHDGDLYGSQQSLRLIIRHLPPASYQCFVSLARGGPLKALLEKEPNVWMLSHRRLQWVKHDPRTVLQRVGDGLSLLAGAPWRVWQLARLIRRERITLVHTNATVSLEGALAAAVTGVPHIWHIRELFMEKSPKFHLVLGRRFSRWLIDQLSDRVICISGAVRAQFGPYAARQPGKYPLIYNALSLPTGPLMPRTSPHNHAELGLTLGYVGRLSAGKGLHELLEALALLKAENTPVRLLVAGDFVDSSYETRIRQLIQAHALAESVQFLGYQTDLDAFYAATDLLVIPSVNEPFGRVVIEAMARGVPCLGAAAGGIPEIIEHGVHGWLYPPGAPAVLAARVAALIDDPAPLAVVRENARRMVAERFTIETQIRMLHACYQSLLGAPPVL